MNPLETFNIEFIENLQQKAIQDTIFRQANYIIKTISDHINGNPLKTYAITYEPIFKENLLLLEKNNIEVYFCEIISSKSNFYMISWNKDITKSISQYKKYNIIYENDFHYEKYYII
jgi:hypothetical protein